MFYQFIIHYALLITTIHLIIQTNAFSDLVSWFPSLLIDDHTSQSSIINDRSHHHSSLPPRCPATPIIDPITTPHFPQLSPHLGAASPIIDPITIPHIPTGDPTSQSSAIVWKEGRNLLGAQQKQQLQQKNGGPSTAGTSKKRPLEMRSFFLWFTDHGDPQSDETAEVCSGLMALLKLFLMIRQVKIY